ncbi:hypothetical protein BGX31_003357 [Mortierella sp. GBA43]|nr:hypothetical protein BGX31_003357 [Mortierella sp. GBA43]
MGKDCDKPHEVHLANHPGYDINNQDDFINKYGSYRLTMMYMVKYGAKARGLVVHQLLGLNHVIGEGENIGSIDDTSAHQWLDATELAKLKSHLKVMDEDSFSGGLRQMKM